MDTIAIDLREIAAATRATSWGITEDGQPELWRGRPGQLEVGQIDGNNVVWKQSSRTYPPEDTERF